MLLKQGEKQTDSCQLGDETPPKGHPRVISSIHEISAWQEQETSRRPPSLDPSSPSTCLSASLPSSHQGHLISALPLNCQPVQPLTNKQASCPGHLPTFHGPALKCPRAPSGADPLPSPQNRKWAQPGQGHGANVLDLLTARPPAIGMLPNPDPRFPSTQGCSDHCLVLMCTGWSWM